MIVHQRLAVAIIVVGLVGVVIAGWAIARGGSLATLRAYVVLAAALAGVQVVIGGILFLTGRRPSEGLHYVYGAAVLTALPAARLYAGRSGPRTEAWALLVGCLLLALLAVRALATGGG